MTGQGGDTCNLRDSKGTECQEGDIFGGNNCLTVNLIKDEEVDCLGFDEMEKGRPGWRNHAIKE